MEIRLLTDNDTRAYWDLRLEALEQDPEAFSAAAEDHRRLSLEEISPRLKTDAGKFVMAAFDTGRMVGTAGFYREKGRKTEHKGYIWGVYVTRELRGKGVGRNLLQAVLERARGIAGVEQIALSVATTQPAARKLYCSLGFEPFGIEPKALKIAGRYIDEEHMMLVLHRPRT
jgi:ribosomal protein S18 acetylase RimI-like enzyme